MSNQTPQTLRPNLPKNLNILRLDPIHCPTPDFSSLPIPYTYTELANPPPSGEELMTYLKTAHVLITTRFFLPSSLLSQLPNLKHVAVLAIGTDHVDLAYCAENAISVSNVPAANIEAVSEHGLTLYMALRRNVVGLHERTREGREWKEKGSLTGHFYGGFMAGFKGEVVGIVGGGELGNRVSNLCRALGMTIQFCERKGIPESETRANYTPFTTVLQTSTVLFLCLPLTPSTQNLIASPELSAMRTDALLINIARGGIVNEDDLVDALKQGKIAGAATDVYVVEPAGESNPLVKAAREGELRDGGRLILSPHVAWYGRSSVEKLTRVVAENVRVWCEGVEGNIVG
ncbi:ed43d9ed-b546-4481-94ed-b887b048ee84 [Sclerotinia trifoliorum]|uniref:Ed43d9ed-b546-4481-94ed-b887b048ee84 n=1 Tax=Sclerotinia trifoliorum TaxID=28548 RepID=A0A8H2W485_9HELO|nr:ed43d9ed-b546-4481-94ed-b887b048ee84 [Sclerotinia trifoliorum]